MDIPTDMTIWPSDKEMTEVIELLKFLAKFLLALMPALTILKEDIDRKHVLDLFLLKFEHALSRMRVPDPSDYKLLPLTDDKVLEIVLKLEQAASLASSLKPTITTIRSNYIRRSRLKPLVLMLNCIRNDVCESIPFEVPSEVPPVPLRRFGPSYSRRTAPPSEVPSAPPSEVPSAPPSEVPSAPPSEVPSAPPSEVPSAPIRRFEPSYSRRTAPNRHVSFSIDLASLSVAERNVLAQEAMESEQFDASQHY
jgi:hypothetical protein